jgi:Protein of unknown function (DUF1592)/Protein of unknown function (DUF1588)/Protein of unknown function (DUF1587)/Protein of unknown function (DUF1585)/Protein of unknown function (DUF1595)/Planctomycete cytochrome C
MLRFPASFLVLFHLDLVFLGGVACLFTTHRAIAAEESVSKLDTALNQEFNFRVRPLLKKYCFECHEGDSAEASTDIATFRHLSKIRESESQWQQIRGLVRIGAMPPPDHSVQPTEKERQLVSNWIERALTEIDCNEPNPLPPVTVRRLNRSEYDNTIRDLFGVDLSPASVVGFVSDDVGNGFDNQGEVLSLSPLILEKYMQAAEWVSTKVVFSDPMVLREQVSEGERIRIGERFGSDFHFAEGEYHLASSLRFGLKSEQWAVEIYLDDKLIDEVEVHGKSKIFTWDVKATAGIHRFEIRVPETEGNREVAYGRDSVLYIDRIVVKGPAKGNPPMPLAHQKIMIAEPSESVSVEEAATQIMKQFLPFAFRRPTLPEERQRIVDIIVKSSKDGWSFPESVQFGIQAILISPEFLFRIEKPFRIPSATSASNPSQGMAPQPKFSHEEPLDEFDLANRLSYFLWSSMPDAELLRLATKNELSNQTVLQKQIDRMLADPKCDALIHGFFDQWLGLRNLASVSVDEREFPIWTPALSEALSKETFLFCKEVLKSGKLRDFLNSDTTFVNPRLADFYNLKFDGQDPEEMYRGSSRSEEYERRMGRYRDEDRWIQVALPEQRRGLLTHASILTLTSNPTRTSPVKRGKWVLDNILGDPPPPAPPNVPSLEESVGEKVKLSLRKQLEQHRENPSCASCHKVLDPIGLGLENFDAIGQWRTTDEGMPIVAESQFADGRKFTSPRELLRLLEADEPKMARHFATQLLTYALGRGLTRADQCDLNLILNHAQASEYSIKSFVYATINSRPFRYNSASQAKN